MKESALTLGMVTEQLKLSKLQIRSILGPSSAGIPPDAEIGNDILIRLLVAELLENIRLTAEQRNLILDETVSAQMGAAVGELAQLCLVDGAYCVATGLRGFLDLNTGELLTNRLPVPPMETISYNLLELYRRGKQRILNRSGQNANGQQNTEGNVEEPADIRDRPADGIS